jgi:hypothetical protein
MDLIINEGGTGFPNIPKSVYEKKVLKAYKKLIKEREASFDERYKK